MGMECPHLEWGDVMAIYIGKIKEIVSEDFDRLFPGTRPYTVLETIKIEFLDRCDDLEEFDARDALMLVRNVDDLTAWFENHFAAYKFEIEVFNV